MTEKWDRRFLDLAQLVSTWSKDPSTRVGAAIISPDKTIVSTGYNGFPRDMADDESRYASRDEKLSRIVHAEINAMIFAGCIIPFGSTLYTWPFAPCDRCVVQLLQAGVKRYVAPTPADEVARRWGASIQRAREYIEESGGILVEYGR